MKNILLGIAAVMCGFSSVIAQQNSRVQRERPYLAGSVAVGFYGGVSFEAGGTLGNFAQDLPLSVRFSIGRTSVDPGDPLLVRKVFINNNTNGTPEESGHIMNFRLDLAHPVHLFSHHRSQVFVGPRYSRFIGEFVYVGGNEDFEVRCNQWGLGAGLDNFFAISSALDLIVTVGADYYFAAKLYGHDATYFPDGQSINSRDDYTYDDADNAVKQPKLKPLVMVGISYRF